ncbi:MAG: 16S rRNA methyltransferase [Thermofilum sp. ex4484_15]|nr:MAG: 16S rRNA methyltransferase [Thermofilum sp. ex4484_15]
MESHYFSERPGGKLRFYEYEVRIRGVELSILSCSGVFSARRLDKGTEVLIKYMEVRDGWLICDLGCGVGVVGLVAASLAPKGFVIMTDINRRAVKLAKLNALRNGIRNVEVRWGDLYEPLRGLKFDTIITNPPQSAGLSVCYSIIREAPNYLREEGLLQMVARHNKGGRRLLSEMKRVFGNCEVKGGESGYRVYIAVLR